MHSHRYNIAQGIQTETKSLYINHSTREASASNERGSVKSVIGSKRYTPFARESIKRDSRTEKQIVTMPSAEVIETISSGIIGSGIKYIMFPLHLLRFCIFGTSSGSVESEKSREPGLSTSDNKKVESQEDEKLKKREERSTKEREESSTKRREERSTKDHEERNTRSREEKDAKKSEKNITEELDERNTKDVEKSEDYSSEQLRKSSKRSSHPETKVVPCCKESSKKPEYKSDEDSDEMVTAEEDSDSSLEHWSNATSTMMNMSLDYDNIDRSVSYLEEPMDISMEEQTYEKSYIASKTANFQASALGNQPSRLYPEDHSSSSSVDEEIAMIFQKQCTSSDDEISRDRGKTSTIHKRERIKQSNFLITRSRKEQQDNDRERSKKTSSDVVVHHKRRKVTHDEDRTERQHDRRAETKTREEKRGSRHDTPSKYKTRSSKTPVKSQESKRKDTRYKETATQTDSAFSDEDVEMIPVDAKLTDKHFCCKYAVRRSLSNLLQDKMEQELNYIADNEDSVDGFTRISRKRISSCSTSSSSTDLGFDERVSATPDTDTATGRWPAITDNAFKTCRPPPGFPQVPQNPPLISSTYDPKQFAAGITAIMVPRAPSPMRHLYYDYPEFMDLPENVNSSNILKNILRNNYYR
ncbi:protein starmaker-like isoform X1 [Hylaeus anthracinus]|uniref:protein starmaker-like isoform X1 n=2 Tax=Hylaeus anthracinus TaxID=313031 RepID=UPI0023B97F6A|nr:protein starmaker-like isoform X1 [Hylaeus anthracinus]